MANFKAGDKAYILVNNRVVKEVTVMRNTAGMYLIKMPSGGGIQVKAHRLFQTEEEANAAVPYKSEQPRKKTPYDYM